jgi:DNA-binding transcriptional regulator YhcF (GntR family)
VSVQISWQIAYQIETGQYPEGARLPTIRELAASFRIDPNTVRSVYGRLVDAGYVTTRQGSGTYVAPRPYGREHGETLRSLVSDLLVRGAERGFGPDQLASAVFAAAQERKQLTGRARVLFVEDTPDDVSYGTSLLAEQFADVAEFEGALVEEIDRRLESGRFDLVATTAGHAADTQQRVAKRLPVVVMLVLATYSRVIKEMSAARAGSTLGLICHTDQGLTNLRAMFRSLSQDCDILEATPSSPDELKKIDQEADIIIVTRAAAQLGAIDGFSRTERVREFNAGYFDPAGLEFLGHAIDTFRAAPVRVNQAFAVDRRGASAPVAARS